MPIHKMVPQDLVSADDEVLEGPAPQHQGRDGRIDWECSGCDTILATRVVDGDMAGVIFCCPNCGALNIVERSVID